MTKERPRLSQGGAQRSSDQGRPQGGRRPAGYGWPAMLHRRPADSPAPPCPECSAGRLRTRRGATAQAVASLHFVASEVIQALLHLVSGLLVYFAVVAEIFSAGSGP